MTARRRRRRALLAWSGGAGLVVVLVIAAAVILLARLPGGLAQIDFSHLLSAGELRYALPTELLQQEVATGFPQTFKLTNDLHLVIDRPRFLPDPDPDFLQLELRLTAVGGGVQGEWSNPGQIAARGRLKFDRANGTVALTEVGIPKLVVPSESGGANVLLPPFLNLIVTHFLEGTIVYRLPHGGGFWQREGVERVRDIRIEQSHVVVVAGA